MTATPATIAAKDPSLPFLDIAIDDERWRAAFDVETVTERAARAATETVGAADTLVSLSVLFTSDAEMRSLNRQFRGLDKPTNVLSWPALPLDHPLDPSHLTPPRTPLGDLALGFETTTREAREAGLSLVAHASHLIVHGVLHLFGYDHENDNDAFVMERLEKIALSSVGLSDPYEVCAPA